MNGLILCACIIAFPFLATAAVDTKSTFEPSRSQRRGAGVPTSQETIRVRLSKIKADTVTVTGLSLRFPGMPQGLAGFRALRLRHQAPMAPGLPPTWIVTDRDRGQEITRLKAKSFEFVGNTIRVNLKPVPNRVAFAASEFSSQAASSIDVVSTLDIEDYLRGVLPSEMPASWPVEALKAQAVAARTFALFRKFQKSQSRSNFDVESDVMDQVFNHPLLSDVTKTRLANVDKAIDGTRAVVLLDPRNQAFQAYFHADCGGRTEEATAVWGGKETLGTAIDGSCPMNPRATWTASYSGRDLAKLLAKSPLTSALFANSAAVFGVQIVKRTNSGRIDEMLVSMTDRLGGTRVATLSGHAFRMAVGFNTIKSTQFTIEPRGALNSKSGLNFALAGQGYGHGVGMCQWGAKQMAREGKSYQAILKHYYPKAKLEQLIHVAPEGISAVNGPEYASITSPKRL
ncbi:MAG: SpoIID/LytB domain-containing protein [Proteobacteria bacterium]|nr:MAG: SpoIID/LytB domain-containing protein [Pseudomonadota bacterium]